MRLALLALLLCLLVPAVAGQTPLPPSRCQSAEETEIAAALARDGVKAQGMALTGVGRSAAARGGEWLVVGWRPCFDPDEEPEAGLPTTIMLYHQLGKARPRPIASLALPSDQRFVSPSEDPVVETPWGPLLLIEAATGGNCWTCEKLLPLRLSGDRLIPVEPQDRRIGLREVTGSDPDIIITGIIATFESYGPFCHACSPSTTIYMRLDKDRLVEACDRFRDNYADDATAAKGELEDFAATARTGEDGVDLFSRALARLLDRLNGGETAAAALPDFMAMATRADRLDTPNRTLHILDYATRLSTLVKTAEATGKLDRGCPVLGLNP
jgi:hypothetical protein